MVKMSTKQIRTQLKASFAARGIDDVLRITVKVRPGSKKNPKGYVEIRVFSETINELCVIGEQFVHQLFADAGVPICGVYGKRMVIDSKDTSRSQTRIPGVIAHFM